jgi:hypothetical protein
MPNTTSDTNDVLDSGSANDYLLAAWTFPIHSCATSGTILTTAGSVFGNSIYVRGRTTVSTLFANVTVAGGTLTAGDCWGLLYNSAGTLLGQTADQTTPWQTAGLQAMTLTATTAGSLTLPAGQYWAAVVATGTTLPTFSRSAMSAASVTLAQSFYNVNTGTVAKSRCGVLATSITTTPADIVPASITATTGIPYWFGLN